MKPNKILIISLLLLALIAVIFAFTRREVPEYKLTSSEMLTQLKDYETNTVNAEEYLQIEQNADSSFLFVDLRTPREFAEGHINNAINIPLQEIFKIQNKEIFSQKNKTFVLYHSNHIGACSPWMLLTQTGFSNCKILLGGYDNIKNLKSDTPDSLLTGFQDEKAKFNFKDEIAKLKSSSGDTTKVETETKPVIPVIKKETKKQGGGC